MPRNVAFNKALVRRYDRSGPRYTSYPTADRFHPGITGADYRRWVHESNEEPIPRPLSLYFHIPFCDTVCYYCGCTKVVTKDHGKADKYIDYLDRELAMHAALFDSDRVVEQLHWGGGTPTFLDNKQTTRLTEITAKHFRLLTDDSGEYSIEIDPRTVDRDKLAILRTSGFNRISLGVQDFNPDIQKAVNRIQPPDITRTVIEQARDLGYKSVNIDLIYGLPLQTVDSFTATLQHTVDMQPDRIAVYNYAHLPERFKPQRRINVTDLPDPEMKLSILSETIRQLTAAGYVYIGMDHFARVDDELAIAQESGTLQRNFQGYSTHRDTELIGVGMSAIGQVHDNYYQNVRDLDSYYSLLDAGHLPLHRGIELEPDDLLRREIIMTLMCNFTLDIRKLEECWDFCFRQHFRDTLEPLGRMQRDGLLNLTDDRIDILPPGRLLARNICMLFDNYLQGSTGNNRFSRSI